MGGVGMGGDCFVGPLRGGQCVSDGRFRKWRGQCRAIVRRGERRVYRSMVCAKEDKWYSKEESEKVDTCSDDEATRSVQPKLLRGDGVAQSHTPHRNQISLVSASSLRQLLVLRPRLLLSANWLKRDDITGPPLYCSSRTNRIINLRQSQPDAFPQSSTRLHIVADT